MTHGPTYVFRTSGRRLVWGLALALAGAPALADTPEWAAAPYDYVVLDQDIRTTLTEFGRNMGLSVALSDAVRGRSHGRVDATSAGEFLETLARTNGLVWYFDGAVLHVSAAREFATRILPVNGGDGAAVLRDMRDLGLTDDRFTLRVAEGGRAISVSGPPAYVATVEQAVRTAHPTLAAAGDDPRVRVYRGRVGIEDVPTAPPAEN